MYIEGVSMYVCMYLSMYLCIYVCMYVWRCPKIGVPPNHPWFSIINHPAIGVRPFMETKRRSHRSPPWSMWHRKCFTWRSYWVLKKRGTMGNPKNHGFFNTKNVFQIWMIWGIHGYPCFRKPHGSTCWHVIPLSTHQPGFPQFGMVLPRPCPERLSVPPGWWCNHQTN